MNEKALTEYLNDKANIIYRYLLKKGCNKEDAEDIIQETMLTFFQCLPELNEDNISAWLFKVANNEYYNLLRKRKRMINRGVDFEILIKNIETEDNIENDFIKKEDIKIVKKAFNKLRKSYQKFLYMKYFEELSYKEIADIEKLKEQNIKITLYRARNKLRKEILNISDCEESYGK